MIHHIGMVLQYKDLGVRTLSADSYLIAKLPAQRPLVTAVRDEYGQVQVKLVAFDDEPKPP